jgi:hypothetical protein
MFKTRKKALGRMALGAAVMAAAALSPDIAHAQTAASGIAGLIMRIGQSIAPAAGVIEILTYLSGAWLGFTGLLKLKTAAESPQNQGMVGHGVARLVLGGLLIALPSFIGVILGSVGLDESKPAEIVTDWQIESR